MMRPAPALMLLAEASEASRVPLRSLRFWIQTGKLPAKRPGRAVLVRRADLARVIGCAESDLEIEIREKRGTSTASPSGRATDGR